MDFILPQGLNVTQVVSKFLMHPYESRRMVVAEGIQASKDIEDCINTTLFEKFIQSVVTNTTIISNKKRREIEGDPMIYIITVLTFYSCGIIILMYNYMKKEQREQEEANVYKQYLDKARSRYEEFNNRGSSLNRLALQALNAVNVISQHNESGGRVAFV
ncbi:uncharacterized protein [Lepeophtheirus salmonis]|uniref:uncharacterized protein n=1 Tax=Lepeophtheirus salmonis TaxID=72036 RepID=UPI001AE2DE35|nr:uncharacterized protein LOC121128567 [Lepeophtheirus salmonis]